MNHCAFICTANDISAMSAPLLDRMDVINFHRYTREQSIEILRESAIERLVDSCGMTGKIRFSPEVAELVVDSKPDSSMREYERIVERLIDVANYDIMMKRLSSYEVTEKTMSRLIPREQKIAVGF